jgi:hypothetical protein
VTSPTDVPLPPPAQPPQPPPAQPQQQAGGPQLRRVLRTATAESFEIANPDDSTRIGAVSVHYGPGVVEGVLTLPAGTNPDAVRSVLGWVTDLLTLDGAAGAGGMIHWVVAVGEVEDFWRRSPGHRPSGAESDLAGAKARVEQVLQGMFEQVASMPDGTYFVDAGSVRVFVAVRLADTDVLIRVFSITNLDVPVDGDLPRFLLGLNFSVAIGRFSLDAGTRAVWFDHVLGADELDDATLARTVSSVAATADKFDDEIKARFGGRTFREEGSPVEHVAAATQPGMAGGYL